MRNLLLAFTGCLLALSGSAAFGQSGETSEYVFIAEESTITQMGGIAGVHRTYSIEGRFQLQIDPEAGVASFLRVDANAVDESDDRNALDPNEVFNLTGLTGTVVDDTIVSFKGMTTISFEGIAPDGSDVYITATLDDDLAYLRGQTMNPPDPADCLLFGLSVIVQRKYAGGVGTADNPYRIATAADLITLGETPEDYDKHFILTADIDLDPNLPGGRVFDKAVIAAHTDSDDRLMPVFSGTSFTGVFDGDGHVISHLTIKGSSYLGLFGSLGLWDSPAAEVRNLGMAAVNIAGSGDFIGAVVGSNQDQGSVIRCHSSGMVSGTNRVGALVGESQGTVIRCYSTGRVSGTCAVGGLVGFNIGMFHGWGRVAYCYSTGAVKGDSWIGGLVGQSDGEVTDCYSTSAVRGVSPVGGLVGSGCDLTNCHSTGAVTGIGQHVGGLVGHKVEYGSVTNCFWDTQTSGQTSSAGGIGKTTAQMQTAQTFLDAGWDFVGETANGTEDIWWILEGRGYPRLWWELPADDFEDGQAGPLWFVYETTPEWAWLEEVNGRLEAHTTGQMEDVDAIYVSDGWRLDATKAFAVRVDFHFGKIGVGDGRVTLGLVPTIELPVTQWAEFEVGAFDAEPFYLYEVRNGVWVEEKVSDRSADDGTLYVSYDPVTDELHLSDKGYGKANARWTVAGLVQGRWQSESVHIILGGGSEDGMALTAGDAWLDNFTIDAGTVVQ